MVLVLGWGRNHQSIMCGHARGFHFGLQEYFALSAHPQDRDWSPLPLPPYQVDGNRFLGIAESKRAVAQRAPGPEWPKGAQGPKGPGGVGGGVRAPQAREG